MRVQRFNDENISMKKLVFQVMSLLQKMKTHSYSINARVPFHYKFV